jgi:hypothetical protein
LSFGERDSPTFLRHDAKLTSFASTKKARGPRDIRDA